MRKPGFLQSVQRPADRRGVYLAVIGKSLLGAGTARIETAEHLWLPGSKSEIAQIRPEIILFRMAGAGKQRVNGIFHNNILRQIVGILNN